jgi:hypothetical protein
MWSGAPVRNESAPKKTMSTEILPEPGPKPGTIRTAANRRKFIEALAITANVSTACKLARVGRNSIYEWRKDDPSFRVEWDETVELGTGALEDEAVRRACEGTLKPVYYGGKKIGTVREYSDSLLIFMLKARRPEKFRERFDIDPGNRFIELLRYLETAGGRGGGSGQNNDRKAGDG